MLIIKSIKGPWILGTENEFLVHEQRKTKFSFQPRKWLNQIGFFDLFTERKKMFSISNLEWMKMVFAGKIGVINSVFHVTNAAYRIHHFVRTSFNHSSIVQRKMRFKHLVNCMLINISNSYNEKKSLCVSFVRSNCDEKRSRSHFSLRR